MRTRWLFLLCLALNIAILYILYVYVCDETMFMHFFSNKNDEVAVLYVSYSKIRWLLILLGVVVVVSRIAVVTLLAHALYSVFKNTIYNVTIAVSKFLKCFLYAEFAYILQNIVQLCIFINNKPASISDFSVVPLSLYDLIGNDNMEEWLSYSLNSLNLFEFFYCVILCLSFVYVMKLSKEKSFKLLIYTYLPVLFLGYLLRVGLMYITM